MIHLHDCKMDEAPAVFNVVINLSDVTKSFTTELLLQLLNCIKIYDSSVTQVKCPSLSQVNVVNKYIR